MGKRDEQHNERKAQILQIALDEFIKKGYYGTSTREIGTIAGVSSGLMFHYFPSKLALYEALIEIGCDKLKLSEEKDLTPLETLEKRAKGILALISTNTFAAKMFVFMGSASYNAAQISEKAREMFSKHDIIDESIPLIKKGQTLGEIRDGDPYILSLAFWCAIQGIAEAVAMHKDAKAPSAEWLLDILRRKD